ncbi:MAG: type IV pilin protein [Gammaproteobacteria bacterium]
MSGRAAAAGVGPNGGQDGFTLIELMIVVVIMGILATASVAGYRHYVQRANRVDATSALLRVSAAQERFYLQNNHYATTAEELGDPPPGGLGIAGTERGFYDLAVDEAAGGPVAGYTISATASGDGPQRDDDACRSFTIDQNGQRAAADAGGDDSATVIEQCWR